MVEQGYRTSRCTQDSSPAQTLHWAVIGGDPLVVQLELSEAIKSAVPKSDWPEARADVKAILERVANCDAIDPDDVKNISMHREIFEIRIELEAHGLLIRIYHTELPEFPQDLILLHAHVKTISGDDDEISELQDQAIEVAWARWMAGRNDAWGLI